MAVSDAKWDGSASNWPDAKSYCNSCLINGNTSDNPDDWTKDACKLPYVFPNGDISRVSVHTCAAVMAGGMGGIKGISPADRKKAAKKLVSLYQNDLKEDPPDSLKKLAGS